MFNRVVSSLTPMQLYFATGVLIIVIAAIDRLTGNELSLSILYLLPVAMIGWYSRGLIVHATCIVCAITWGVIDFSGANGTGNTIVTLWNTGMLAGFFLLVATLLNRLKSAQDMQETLTQLDGLTGIMNTRAFRQYCASVCDLSMRKNRPFALGYIGLDNFKTINNTYGYSTGDQALIATADALKKRLRVSDFCARLGSDEFAVLLPDTDINGAKVVFQELYRRLVNFAARNQWPIGFSIGVAIFQLNRGSPDEVIHYTGELMHKVKRTGKNRIEFEEIKSFEKP